MAALQYLLDVVHNGRLAIDIQLKHNFMIHTCMSSCHLIMLMLKLHAM